MLSTNKVAREDKWESERYPSNLTDAECLIIASLLSAAKRGGCKKTKELREVVIGILQVVSSGCP